MTKEPAMLIGIDTLGLVDVLMIDYRRTHGAADPDSVII